MARHQYMLDTQSGQLWQIMVDSNDVARLHQVYYHAYGSSVKSPSEIEAATIRAVSEKKIEEAIRSSQKEPNPEWLVGVIAQIDAQLESEDYRAEAEAYLRDNVTEIELLGIAAKAQSGEYGKDSAGMLAVANRWISIGKETLKTAHQGSPKTQQPSNRLTKPNK